MESAALRELYERFADIAKILAIAQEPSLLTAFDDTTRKAVLVSAASYFEVALSMAVADFCRKSSAKNTLVPAFVEIKAIRGQYHTWFSWEQNGAATFFAMFGPDFKAHMANVLKDNADLEDQISAFMELGRERNKLVHGDYAQFTVEKTTEEIYETYLKALEFVRQIPKQLEACAAQLAEKEQN